MVKSLTQLAIQQRTGSVEHLLIWVPSMRNNSFPVDAQLRDRKTRGPEGGCKVKLNTVTIFVGGERIHFDGTTHWQLGELQVHQRARPPIMLKMRFGVRRPHSSATRESPQLRNVHVHLETQSPWFVIFSTPTRTSIHICQRVWTSLVLVFRSKQPKVPLVL